MHSHGSTQEDYIKIKDADISQKFDFFFLKLIFFIFLNRFNALM
jgi:hypothetical protein